MKAYSFHLARLILLCLFVVSHLLLVGCNDESKTTGTQVQLSDEAKAQLDGRKKLYKSKNDDLKEKKTKGKAKSTRGR